MKQIYLHILVGTVAALTLVACDKENIELAGGDVAPIFAGTIEGGQTRAIGCDWEEGDKIGITYYAGSNSKDNVYNVCHMTENGDGKFTVEKPEEQIYYKTTNLTSSVTFNAYYPYIDVDDPSVTANRKVNVNTIDQTKQKSFDFLFGTAKGSKSNPAMNLDFKHKMSKVTFVFKDGNDFNVSSIVSYKLNGFVMDGSFNVVEGTCLVTTTGVSVTPVEVKLTGVKDGEAVMPCILFPQTAKEDPKLEIIDRDGNFYTGVLKFADSETASKYRKIEAGKNYKFTITVSKKEMTVSNCTIDKWNDYEWPEGGGTGTAGSADDPTE